MERNVSNPANRAQHKSEDLFREGGAAGALMRAIDWASTPLGPVETWSQALRATVGLLLRNHSAMLLWWGPEVVQLYNDAYTPVLGAKHPRSMGQPSNECWAEIWHIIGPMVEAPLREGRATTSDDLFLLMNRHGFVEETHFKVAYSPVPDDSVEETGIGGVLATVSETTEQVYGERQLRTLRELGTRVAESRTSSAAEASRIALSALAQNDWDVPFAMIYLLSPAERRLTLAGSVGFQNTNAKALLPELELGSESDAWSLASVLASGRPAVVERIAERAHELPRGRWELAVERAVALPLASPDQEHAYGVLVCGVSPHRKLDDGYRTFFDLVAAQTVTAIRNALAYDAERKRAEALAEIDRAKTTFFSNISHEFRTPLTLMLGPQEDALTSSDGCLRGDELRAVHRNTRRLLKLVNTLLDFSRIEAGRVQASYEAVDLSAVTQDLASSFRSAVERGGLEFEVVCPPLQQQVYVDRDMWEKIVLNLLSNAFKFTFQGKISISLRETAERAELVVTDTGIGIAERELPRLFERFYRVEGAKARTHEGSGIGLALVHDLVRLHAGKIDVRSRLGEGTSFVVSLPLGRAHLPADRVGAPRSLTSTAVGARPFVDEALQWLSGAPSESVPPASAVAVAAGTSANERVLVVDDNADMRDYLARLLRRRFQVEVAADGAQALALACANPPNLILSDVMMPGLDGFGLLRALREDERTAHVPVVMLSARAGEEARIEGLERGADDYLTKPFSARELLARVESQLSLSRARKEQREARVEAALQLSSAAEAANRTKDQFLAMLSHELRNPLAPIVTALQGMRLRERGTREIGIIERQVAHLVRLVDDLLDISRITRGKLELRKQKTDLAAVIARAVEMAKPVVEQRRQQLEVRFVGEVLSVDGDEYRLAQVVSNLLTNAAKYSEPATKIELSVERSGEHARVRVRDHGFGIEPHMLGSIFDMFVQQQQPLDRSQGGLGLGLAIVKSLVELHGGVVSASSDGLGKGSEFSIELPLSASASRPSAYFSDEAGQSSWASPDETRRRILIVDDNVDAVEMLAVVLGDLGFEVKSAHDGPSALEVAGTFAPDVCLLDIGLPVMDGYEVARKLRRQPGFPEHARIIAITGYGQDADRKRSADAGVNVHLVKPVTLDVLAKVVGTGKVERERPVPTT